MYVEDTMDSTNVSCDYPHADHQLRRGDKIPREDGEIQLEGALVGSECE